MSNEQMKQALKDAADVGELVRQNKIEYDPVEKIGPLYCYDCTGHLEKNSLSWTELGNLIHQTKELISLYKIPQLSYITSKQSESDCGIWLGDISFRHAYIDFTTGNMTLFCGGYIKTEPYNKEQIISFLKGKHIKGLNKRQHTYYHYKKFTPQYVFDNFIGDNLGKKPIDIETGIVKVKPNSSRYHMFKEKGLACSVCGFEATHARLCVTESGIAHFAFFDTDDIGKEVLFHRHYRVPANQGGGKGLDNIVPICDLCHVLLEGS
jgi:hypothetical protein